MLLTLQQSELHNGDRMSREEFLRRWEQIPELKHAVLLRDKCVEWRVLSGTRYRLLHQPKDGILRSPHFAGLWLDTQALFPAEDLQRLFKTVDRGVALTK